MKVLRPYQAPNIELVCEHLAAGHPRVVFQGPTGSGKSTSLTFLLTKLVGTRDYDRAVIAVPQEQIKHSFNRVCGLYQYPTDEEQEQGTLTFGARRMGDANNPDQFGGRPKHAWWASKPPNNETLSTHLVKHLELPSTVSAPRVALVTHGTLREAKDRLPASMVGKILVLDEGNHANVADDLQTDLGKVADMWVERGGVVIYATATPFRTDRVQVAPTGTPEVTRSMVTHAREGYAPAKFEIKVIITGQPKAQDPTSVFQGTSLTGPAAYVEEWVAQGHPFTVMLVPVGNSGAWATELEGLLRAAGARVLNVVGTGDAKKKELADALKAYDDLVQDCERTGRRPHVSEIPFDVVLAVMRFNEGTDYPPLSSIFCPNIPQSFSLDVQRLGRTTRMKRHPDGTLIFEGYNPDHADTASMTFFVFNVKDESILDKGQLHSDYHIYVMQLLCYLGQTNVGSLVAEYRSRIGEHFKSKPKPKTVAEAIALAHGTDSQTLTDDERIRHGIGSTPGTLEGVIGDILMQAVANGVMPSFAQVASQIDPDDVDARPKLLLLIEQFVSHLGNLGLNADQVVDDIIRDHTDMREKGQQALRDSLSNGASATTATLIRARVENQALRTLLQKYGDYTVPIAHGILTKFSSEDASRITRDIVSKLGDKYALREPVIYRAILAFRDQHGRDPLPHERVEMGGLPITRGDLDVYTRLGTSGLPAGRSIESICATGDLLTVCPPHETPDDLRALLSLEGRPLPRMSVTALPTHRAPEIRARGWKRPNAGRVNLQVLSHAVFHGWTSYPANTTLHHVAAELGIPVCAPAASELREYNWTRPPSPQEHVEAATRWFNQEGQVPDKNVLREDASPYYEEAVRRDNPGTFTWADCVRVAGSSFEGLTRSLRPKTVSSTIVADAEARFQLDNEGRSALSRASAHPYTGLLLTWGQIRKGAKK